MKTKIRLTALDITALVTELKQQLLNTRLSNIYNVDAKTYIFKFSLQEQKAYLVVENGLRFNLTDKIEKNKNPSGFTMKFRKFLRSRRLEQIEQIGVERVVVFTFGREDHTHYLILELYSQGNIILADKDYRIIQLTRQHQFSEQVKVAPGEIYPFQYTATNYLEKFDTSIDHIQKIIKEKPLKFKEVLFKIVPCLHASLTDDLIIQCGFNPNEKITNQIENVKKVVDQSMEYLHKFRAQPQYKGYIVAREIPKENEKPKYFDFAADLALYHKNKHIEEFPNFNAAVDKYFETVDRQAEDNKPTIEEIAWKKFENIKQDQLGRINKLQQEQDEFLIKARLIEENINDVQAIIEIIQKMVDAGIAWDKIQKMINDSKKEGNPLSNMIGTMNLKQNKINILLGEKDDEYSELYSIEVDITLSAYANARKLFENKKKHKQKEDKTKEAVDQALKKAEQMAVKEIEREKNKIQKIQNARKKYWFEKFYWFISSDGYLVISGRDVQQNELIVKKYLNKDDIYMHADIHGSASTIIKNPNTGPIPDPTIQQAATATICRSKAWDAKIVVSAWWVYASQVTKSPPAGLFIPAGSFMIYGKKNYVYPPRLEMGATVLYQLDQESIKRHEAERLKKQKEELKQIDIQQDETEEVEEIEKNLLDSDNEETQQDQNEEDLAPIKTVVQGNQEVTIIEVNPNARKIQQRNDQKQKEKEQQQQQQQQQQPKQQQSKSQQQQKQQKTDTKKQQSDEELQQKQQQPKRGNKNKQKKAKEKYKDQSDDERELTMKLMGATYMKGEKQKQKDKKNKNKNKDQYYQDQQGKQSKGQKQQGSLTQQLLKEQGIEQKEDEIEQTQNQQKLNQIEKQEQQEQQEQLEQQEQQEQQEKQEQQEQQEQQKQQKQQEQQEEIQQETKQVGSQQEGEGSKEQKKNDDDSDSDKEDINQDEKDKEPQQEGEENIEYLEMQKLVQYLYQDDNYLSLVPMVAPYQVIANSKFKMKIGPGSLKKGKAGRDIINYFMSIKDCTQQEKHFIKMITDEEIVQTMLSGSKLTAAGMLQMKQKEKQLKKQQHKK